MDVAGRRAGFYIVHVAHVGSLRKTLTVATITITGLASVVAVALVGITSYLREEGNNLAESVESVRLLEEAELDLLLHARLRDPVVVAEIERRLHSRLREAQRSISTNEESMALQNAQASVDRYLATTHTVDRTPEQLAALLDQAYEQLQVVVAVNLDQAESARRRAIRGDMAARVVGVGIGVLVLLLSGALVWWANRRAFRPLFGLARSIEQFAHGDRTARAEEIGPSELREMAKRFNNMADALAQQREAQIRFLGGVAHDLKNPLSALRLSVGSIRPDGPLPPEPRVRRVLGTVERQIVRLERMVGDFLDVAKIESGQLALKLEPCDVRGLVQEVVTLFEAGSPQHRFAITVPAENIPVRCDSLRIEQVLSNLVSNAIKYSPEATAIEISAAREGDSAVITVTDHGIGIPAEEHSTLFQPFRRVGLSKESIPGVGLGLFVVRQIVDAHGGRIEVDSEPGRGSTFRLYLPLFDPRSAAESGRPALELAGVA